MMCPHGARRKCTSCAGSGDHGMLFNQAQRVFSHSHHRARPLGRLHDGRRRSFAGRWNDGVGELGHNRSHTWNEAERLLRDPSEEREEARIATIHAAASGVVIALHIITHFAPALLLRICCWMSNWWALRRGPRPGCDEKPLEGGVSGVSCAASMVARSFTTRPRSLRHFAYSSSKSRLA